MNTGINALERLSIRVSENPGKDIRDVIKQNDIMSIKTSPNSGVKGLIFHALTGRTYEGRGREYLYGEGESTSSRQAEKIQTTKDREAQAKREGVLSGKRSASKAGIHNRPKLKVTPFKKGDSVIWANKDNDLPVNFIRVEPGKASDGKRYAQVEREGKISYVPLAELKAK